MRVRARASNLDGYICRKIKLGRRVDSRNAAARKLMAELRMERTRNLPQLCKHLGTVRRLAYIFETNLLPDVIAKTRSNSRIVVRLFSVG
jgi:hypothetical protein